MASTETRHDVVVVGARAAGGAVALLLARLGHDVVVLDRADFPSDTVSTHAIARSGVVQLRRWGLLDQVLASGAPPICQVSFHAQGESVTRTVRKAHGVGHLVAPRRYVLDSVIAAAAASAGAQVRTGVTVTDVCRDDAGRAVGVRGRDRAGRPVRINARYVVGADGLGSRVARAVEAPVLEHRGDRGATQYAYFAGLPWRGFEYYTGPRALAGVFPTHDGQACVWVCTPSQIAQDVRRRARSRAEAFGQLLRCAAPQLARRLSGARRTSPVQGMLRTPNQVRQAVGPGWALVGDAGYHRDAVTGHGISDAFRDAEFLAVALGRALRGEVDGAAALAEYQRQRDRALREIFELTCAMADYPPVPEFVALHKRIGSAIETEAAALAARPIPGERPLVHAH